MNPERQLIHLIPFGIILLFAAVGGAVILKVAERVAYEEGGVGTVVRSPLTAAIRQCVADSDCIIVQNACGALTAVNREFEDVWANREQYRAQRGKSAACPAGREPHAGQEQTSAVCKEGRCEMETAPPAYP